MRKFSLRMPKHYDRYMHAAMLVLMLFGSIMIASTSVGESTVNIRNVIMVMVKQCVFVVASYLVMVFMARNFTRFLSKEVLISDNPRKNRRIKNIYRKLFYMAGIGLILMLTLTLAFPAVNGSKAWINLGFMTLQPSEFVKVYMIILLGVIVNDYGSQKIEFWNFMLIPFVFFAVCAAVIFIQPDLGTLIVFTCITSVILLIPSNPSLKTLKIIIYICLFIVGFVLLFITTDFGINILKSINGDYKLGRIINAADPFEDIFGNGYNLVYSLYAIATGGLKGLGLGASKQKFGYLPEAQTDFIFAVTIEELGIIGLGIIVVCYGIIIYRLFYYAMKTKSEGFKMILIGCILYLSVHFILNVGGISALIPLTGVPLLFISSGGSSLLSIMCLLGVCQSIIALTRSQMEKQDLMQKKESHM